MKLLLRVECTGECFSPDGKWSGALLTDSAIQHWAENRFSLCFFFTFLSFVNHLCRIMTSSRCCEKVISTRPNARRTRAAENLTEILAFSSWPMCYSNFSHEFQYFLHINGFAFLFAPIMSSYGISNFFLVSINRGNQKKKDSDLFSDWRPRRLHKMRVKRREILDVMKEERNDRKVVELPLRIPTTKRALTRTRLGHSERWTVFDAFTLIFASPLNSFLNRFQFIPCIQIVTVDLSHASFVIQHRALSFDPKCLTLTIRHSLCGRDRDDDNWELRSAIKNTTMRARCKDSDKWIGLFYFVLMLPFCGRWKSFNFALLILRCLRCANRNAFDRSAGLKCSARTASKAKI